MSSETIVRILREGLLMILLLSGGPMLASMLVGFMVSLFQATTQIQEQTLSYVPKLVAVFLTLMILGPWISEPGSEIHGSAFRKHSADSLVGWC